MPSAAPDAVEDSADADEATDDQGAEADEAAVDWRAFVPSDVADHLATMDSAARDSGCGVPWHLLAAIARVESDFGRNMATSTAGAIGYGQFLPSSWQAFGSDGNAYDYRDALPAIATYLCQSGLARDPRAALFAYNHADWYVDLVLDLAVRYDRLAPGAPTPDVLDIGPLAEAGAPIRYAAGRDLRLQSRAHASEATDWLGVPWRGRAPGVPISAASMETTTLSMLRSGLGLSPEPPPSGVQTGSRDLTSLANRAWAQGLLPERLATPAESPIQDIRRSVKRGEPVAALLESSMLPGHPPAEGGGDQPVIVIGATPDGLVYSDPSFSSSLGYGLELKDADFLAAWQSASSPLQALGFSIRPRPLARAAHLNVAVPPPVMARVFPTPRPRAVAPLAAAGLPLPTSVVPDDPPHDDPAAAARLTDAAERPTDAAATTARDDEPDRSWLIILAAGLFVGHAYAFRRVRARRSA